MTDTGPPQRFQFHALTAVPIPGRSPYFESHALVGKLINFPLTEYAGPGFYTWPGSADVLVGEYETRDSHPKKRRSERRSAPRPGSATHGYKRSEYETTGQAAKPPL